MASSASLVAARSFAERCRVRESMRISSSSPLNRESGGATLESSLERDFAWSSRCSWRIACMVLLIPSSDLLFSMPITPRPTVCRTRGEPTTWMGSMPK